MSDTKPIKTLDNWRMYDPPALGLCLMGEVDGQVIIIQWSKVESYDISFYYDDIEDDDKGVVETEDTMFVLGSISDSYLKEFYAAEDLFTISEG